MAHPLDLLWLHPFIACARKAAGWPSLCRARRR